MIWLELSGGVEGGRESQGLWVAKKGEARERRRSCAAPAVWCQIEGGMSGAGDSATGIDQGDWPARTMLFSSSACMRRAQKTWVLPWRAAGFRFRAKKAWKML